METLNRIINETLHLSVLAEDIGEKDSLDEFGLNSIDFIKLIIALESEFDLEIDNQYLVMSRLNTKEKIKKYMEREKNGQL